MIVNLQRAIEGFTVFVFKEGGSDAFFNDVGATTYIMKEALYEAQTIIGDGFMVGRLEICAIHTHGDEKIYRLYIVWSKDKRILIPGAIWMSGSFCTSASDFTASFLSQCSAVLAVYGLVSLSELSTVTPIFIAKIKHIGLSFYAITLGVNMICTGKRAPFRSVGSSLTFVKA